MTHVRVLESLARAARRSSSAGSRPAARTRSACTCGAGGDAAAGRWLSTGESRPIAELAAIAERSGARRCTPPCWGSCIRRAAKALRFEVDAAARFSRSRSTRCAPCADASQLECVAEALASARPGRSGRSRCRNLERRTSRGGVDCARALAPGVTDAVGAQVERLSGSEQRGAGERLGACVADGVAGQREDHERELEVELASAVAPCRPISQPSRNRNESLPRSSELASALTPSAPIGFMLRSSETTPVEQRRAGEDRALRADRVSAQV